MGWLRAFEPTTEFVGFIDDVHPADCLGSIHDHEPLQDVTYLVANGSGTNRLKIADSLMARGAKMGSLVSPMAVLGSRFTDDSQVMILGDASVSVDVRLGRQVLVQEKAVIGHDVRIGDGCTVSSFCFIGGGATLGSEVTVYPHVTILPRISVGNKATLGAGSVVIKNIQPSHSVFGNPARPI